MSPESAPDDCEAPDLNERPFWRLSLTRQRAKAGNGGHSGVLVCIWAPHGWHLPQKKEPADDSSATSSLCQLSTDIQRAGRKVLSECLSVNLRDRRCPTSGKVSWRGFQRLELFLGRAGFCGHPLAPLRGGEEGRDLGAEVGEDAVL